MIGITKIGIGMTTNVARVNAARTSAVRGFSTVISRTNGFRSQALIPRQQLQQLQQQTFKQQQQLRFLSDEHKKQIDQAVAKKPLVIFMKGTPNIPQCGFSRAVIQIMQIQGVDFKNDVQTYNVLEDDDLRTAIKEYSSWPTIPQVYVNGEFVGGCDIVLEMHSNGQLATELQNAGVISAAEQPASSSQ